MNSFKHGEINEFVNWYDTDGNIINASDGGIIFAEGKYHWYGQALRPMGKDNLQIMMFERHNTSNFLECSYVWLPVIFNDDNTISFKYVKEWTL